MDSNHSPPPAVPAAGLPPVTPPSGKFIAQLFLVPGLMVLVAVFMVLALRYLFGGGDQPADFLKKLDSDNADIRWRGASDLAQVLNRPEAMYLRSDPAFALELAQRLRTGFNDLLEEEKRVQARTATASAADKKAAWGKPLNAKRDYVNFLAAALGDFVVPVGVPLLSEIVLRADSPDPRSILRRRQALGALAGLGDNRQAFHKLPPDQQAAIVDVLTAETGSKNPQRAVWARNGLYHLDKKHLAAGSTEGIVLVDQTLAEAALDQDQNLRELVGLAFNFWDGPRAEATLQRLARDRGHGTLAGFPE
jgi:hypothetical protein